MSRTTELSLYILCTAALLGLIGEGLRASPLGINVALWGGSLLLAGVWLAQRRRPSLPSARHR